MNAKQARPGKPKTRSVKTAIFSLGITTILGLWSIFSRQTTQAALSSSSTNTLLLDLPPIPTLIAPVVNTGSSSVAQSPSATASPTSISSSTVILMGGSQPSSGSGLNSGGRSGGGRQPAPVASTGSSR